ncbi:MAG: NAD(P)/FAD-dependent oxidoreductase [Bacteriovoracia bacterium]
MIYSVAVIGSGSAGTMAALRAVLNNDSCLLFSGAPKDRKRSRAMWVKKVENMPAHFGYKKGIDDPNAEVIAWINQSAFSENLTYLKNTGVTRIEKRSDGIFDIVDSKNQTHQARFVVLCTGVMDVQPLIENKISPIFPFANAQAIDYCLRCDGHHVKSQHASVIGHTTSAAWVAVMLFERYQTPSMTIFLNGEPQDMDADILELVEMYGIKIVPHAIKSVLGDTKAGELKGFELSDGSSVSTTLCFVALGMIVYSELAKSLGVELDARGFVKADAQGKTSLDGFYVAGDVMAGTKKQIYTAWDTAVNAVDAINQKLRAEKRQKLLNDFRMKKT